MTAANKYSPTAVPHVILTHRDLGTVCPPRIAKIFAILAFRRINIQWVVSHLQKGAGKGGNSVRSRVSVVNINISSKQWLWLAKGVHAKRKAA